MDIAEKRVPQDGHFVTTLEGTKMNLRVSVIPTVYGEKAVLRFLNSNTPILNDTQYGMNLENYQKMRKMMEMPAWYHILNRAYRKRENNDVIYDFGNFGKTSGKYFND